MIKDLDTIALRWCQAFEVEFTTLAGRTGAVVTLADDQVRPIRADEIANARQVAA